MKIEEPQKSKVLFLLIPMEKRAKSNKEEEERRMKQQKKMASLTRRRKVLVLLSSLLDELQITFSGKSGRTKRKEKK